MGTQRSRRCAREIFAKSNLEHSIEDLPRRLTTREPDDRFKRSATADAFEREIDATIDIDTRTRVVRIDLLKDEKIQPNGIGDLLKRCTDRYILKSNVDARVHESADGFESAFAV